MEQEQGLERLKSRIGGLGLPKSAFPARGEAAEPVLDFQRLTTRLQRHRQQQLLERDRAPGVCETLLALPAAERLRRAQRPDLELQSFAVVDELLRRCRAAGFRDLKTAEELVELAWELAQSIHKSDQKFWSAATVADLLARVLATQANVYRIGGRWAQSERAFEKAFSYLQQGSGDVRARAELLSLHVSLLKDRRRLQQALAAAAAAATIYRRLGERQALGKVLLNRASLYHEMGDPESALEAHLKACQCLDDDLEPEVTAAVWSNLASFYCELDRFEEANQVLDRCEHLEVLCGLGSTARLNVAWVRAQVLRGQKRYEEAEKLFLETRTAFQELDRKGDCALMALDLAILYTQMGRSEEVQPLAIEAYKALEGEELYGEASAALLLLVEKARERQLALEVLRQTARELRRYLSRVRRPYVS